MRYYRINLLFFLLCFGSFTLAGQQCLDQFIRNEIFLGSQIGVAVQDVNTKEKLISHNADAYFTPASTLKLITGFMGLKILGDQYKFYTDIVYSGSIDKGILKGDLIILGGGDPTLGSTSFVNNRSLDQILKTIGWLVQKEEISAIHGDIIVYNGRYENYDEQDSWPFQDLGNYYGASAEGFNINENIYTLTFERSRRVGVPTKVITTSPPQDSIRWINSVMTGKPGSGDQAYIMGAPFSWERYLKGTIPAGNTPFTIKGSLPFPALQFGGWLVEELSKRKIKLKGELVVSTEKPEGALTDIGRLESPVLMEIVAEMNERSVNLFAEAILKEIAYVTSGIGSTHKGLEIINTHLSSLNGNVHLVDGSGLSPFNAISPEMYCSFMQLAHADETIWKNFLASMAIYGKTGTLKHVMRNTELAGKAYGKSGSIAGVRAYTGYMKTKGGRELVFTVFLDKFYEKWSQAKPAFEKLMVDVYNEF